MAHRAGYAVVEPTRYVVSAFAPERKVSYQQLDHAIAKVLSSIKPSEADREFRRDTVKSFRIRIRSIKGDAKVEPYGSFVYNIYTKDADLDMSVDIPNSLTSDAQVLEKIWSFLQKNRPVGKRSNTNANPIHMPATLNTIAGAIRSTTNATPFPMPNTND